MLFEENNFNANFEDDMRKEETSREASVEEKPLVEIKQLEEPVVKEFDEDENIVINRSGFNVGKETVRALNNGSLNRPKTLVRKPINFRMPGYNDKGFSAIAILTALIAISGIVVFYLMLKI